MDYQNIATVALEAVAAAAIPTIIYIAKGIASDFITRHFDVKKMQLELSHAGINITSEKVSEIVNSTIENAIKALNLPAIVNVPTEDKESLKQAENAVEAWIVGGDFIARVLGESKEFYTPEKVGQVAFSVLADKVKTFDNSDILELPLVEFLSASRT